MSMIGVKYIAMVLFGGVALMAQAQTEGGGGFKPNGGGLQPVGVPFSYSIDMKPQLQTDSLRWRQDLLKPDIPIPQHPTIQSFTQLTRQGATGFHLWRGASLGFYGTTSLLPGLMTTEAGGMVLRQDMGRWHFTATGNINKYWMPWQRSLATQYGFGGTVGYDLSEHVTLHAFGYYYANQMLVGPAMSPFINTTTFGGFADIRVSKNFGTNLGVRRYLNPMTGQWETAPIVSPYIKFNNGAKFELPLGDLLKEIILRRQDHQREFRPHPLTHPQ